MSCVIDYSHVIGDDMKKIMYVACNCLSIFDNSCFFFQAEDGIRYLVRSRGLGDVYKRQGQYQIADAGEPV